MTTLDEARPLTLQEMLERDKDKIAKIAESKSQNPTTTVDPEDEMLSEFGLYYGWNAVWYVKTNKITASDMHSLLLGARKVSAANRYNNTVDVAAAFAGGKALEGRLAEIRRI